MVAPYDVAIKDALGEAGEEVALMLVAGETFEEVVLEAWTGDRNGERYIWWTPNQPF